MRPRKNNVFEEQSEKRREGRMTVATVARMSIDDGRRFCKPRHWTC
jgi:hypothetical protein